jgi:hypothetical protein
VAVTARTWVTGELANAAKLNTLRDDILELDAVAGFNASQYGTLTIGPGNLTGTATISAVSTRAIATMLGFSTDATESQYPGATPRFTKTNSTTLTGTRDATNGTTTISFCVAESRG